ncbi:MAG: hypothetical protein H7233_09545 [Pseudorhodobacter sp.]|nr:hypothetical protein [Frankiaceae bacterium]
MDRLRNAGGTVVTVLLVFLFAIATYFVVLAAGGTQVRPDNSNTPNATVPGPPPFP